MSFVKLRSLLVLAVSAAMLVACSSDGGKGPAAAEKPESPPASAPPKIEEPVTLKVAISMNWLGDGEFERYFAGPVKKKYPHISFEIYDQAKKEHNIDTLIASGTIPDIVMQSSALPDRYFGKGLEMDIQPLIKKHEFDISKIDPVALDTVTSASGSTMLTGLPWTRHFSALYYNKSIFDKFGVAYPKDGMTWDQLHQLAVKLTRNEESVQYRGLEPDQPGSVGSVLSLPVHDASGKSTLNTDGWKCVFTMLAGIYAIPGNSDTKFAQGAWDQFTKNKTLAMYPTNNRLPQLKDFSNLDWDIAQYPSFPEKPNTGMGADVWILCVTKQSKHQDDAFKAIATVLSEEVQTDMGRNARFPVVINPKVKEDFGKDLPFLKGKNVQAAFLSQPAKVNKIEKYTGHAGGILQNAITDVAKGKSDINTALRVADEQFNQKIAATP